MPFEIITFQMQILNYIQMFKRVIIQGNRAYIYIFLDIVSNAMTFHFFSVAWGYHRQGFCQAGFSTVVSKVIFYWLLLLLGIL